MSSADRVYTFECSLTIAGKNLSVAAINVDMTVGSIPTIEFNVDPFHEKGQSPKQAFTPSLKHYFTGSIPDAIYEAVNKSEPNATFSLTVKSSSDTQTIQCNGWVPVGAGYNEASSVNMAGFSVTIAHPLILANRSSRIIPYFGKFEAIKTIVIKGVKEPFYDFIKRMLRNRVSKISSTKKGVPKGSMSLTKLNERAKLALSNLETNLVWESGTKDTYSNEYAHKYACASMINHIFADEAYTPLQAITSMVCPNYFIRLAPDSQDLSKPMVLAPLEPWGDVAITIEDKEISKLQPAPVSTEQMSGVALASTSFKDNPWAQRFGIMNQFAVVEPEEAVTTPEKFPSGPLRTVPMPGWMSDYANMVQGPVTYTSGANLGTKSDVNAQEPPETKYMRFYVDKLKIWLKAQLQYLHYADKTVMVFTKLLLTKGGNLVRPGVVYEIDGGGPLCYFYGTKIRHRINVAAAEAYTVIEGAYFRSSKGGAFSVTPAKGAKNPLFG